MKTTAELSDFIQEKLNGSFEMRPFPQSVIKLNEMVRQSDVDLKKVGKIIEADPAFCSRVFRIANSPIMGLRDQVTKIDNAVALMGLSRLRSLANTHAAAAVFSANERMSEVVSGLWKHSVACAITARTLAEKSGDVDANQAFLAGIFHDIGQLFFLNVIGDVYEPLMIAQPENGLLEQEKANFQTTHPEVGSKLALHWNLPEEVRVAIAYHENPAAAIAHEKLTLMVHLGDCLVNAWGLGRPPQDLESAQANLDRLNVSLDDFESLREAIETELNDMV